MSYNEKEYSAHWFLVNLLIYEQFGNGGGGEATNSGEVDYTRNNRLTGKAVERVTLSSYSDITITSSFEYVTQSRSPDFEGGTLYHDIEVGLDMLWNASFRDGRVYHRRGLFDSNASEYAAYEWTIEAGRKNGLTDEQLQPFLNELIKLAPYKDAMYSNNNIGIPFSMDPGASY
jgi:hypothetical protein